MFFYKNKQENQENHAKTYRFCNGKLEKTRFFFKRMVFYSQGKKINENNVKRYVFLINLFTSPQQFTT